MEEYLILLPDDEGAWARLDEAGRQAVYDRHEEFTRRLEAEGHLITGGAELAPSSSARTVREVEGRIVVTDGPASDAVEQLSGYYVVQTADPDALAQACGLLAAGAPVELRPVARTDSV